MSISVFIRITKKRVFSLSPLNFLYFSFARARYKDIFDTEVLETDPCYQGESIWGEPSSSNIIEILLRSVMCQPDRPVIRLNHPKAFRDFQQSLLIIGVFYREVNSGLDCQSVLKLREIEGAMCMDDPSKRGKGCRRDCTLVHDSLHCLIVRIAISLR